MNTGVSYSLNETRPREVVEVANRRMEGFVAEYGRTIMFGAPITLLQFAKSCYLQGVEDMAHAAAKEMIQLEPLDYQI